MIIFNLKCQLCDYAFEGWFDSSNEYIKQKKNKLIQKNIKIQNLLPQIFLS